EGDAQGVEIAAGIHRSIHASGLFRSHVRERAGEELGWCRRLPLAEKARGGTKTRQSDRAHRVAHEDVRGIDVSMDEAAFMQPAERGGQRLRQAEKRRHRHRGTREPVKEVATRVVEHQDGAVVLAQESQGPYRPWSVEMISQAIFVSQPIES